ncbi:MAG: hypothetical protein HUU55_21030, partial [Myxococcales bacterium]|nr:hypothetical protein [Myxococcales bacterium]
GDNTFTCDFDLNAGNCLIGDVCFADGAENPDNQCQICDAAVPDAWTDKSNGTACNADSSGCTVDDACADGVCTAGSAAVCNDNLTCTTDSCVSTGDNTFTCDFDLDAGNCLIGGVCFAAGAENPDNQCQMCDATVPDAWTDKSNGTACNADDSGCTVDDACADGVCTAGAAPDCDDNLTCTTDSCSSTGDNTFVCVNELQAGNCTIGGVCFADGAENPANQCQICDPATSSSAWTNKSEGTLCNDGVNCTENDACSAGGVCQGTAIDCSGLSDQCNLGTCEEATGTCFAQPINQGMACDDSFACTVGDRCLSGTCTGVNNSSLCDDTNGCTTNVCQPTNAAADAEGCIYLPNSLPCSDGDACTLNDTCAGGTCQAGPLLNCNDLNECTADECNAGNCTHTPQVGTCDNANQCTIGVCSLTGLCLITPVVCIDGNVCTSDTCEPTQGCVYPNLTNGTICDDDEPCTLDTVCTDGACGGGIPNSCDDGNPCTADSCIPGTGCQNVIDDNLTCDDGDLCTTNVCITGVCTITDSVDCTDINPCTIDVCNPITGLCDVFEPNGTLCEDGDQCTGPDICIDGNCSITPIDECFTPTVNVLCVMYGPAGTIFDCEILLAKSEAGAFALENAATGLQVLLEYDETQVTLQGFVDEICFGPGLCFEYTVGAPGFPNAIDSGHTLATQPEELVDWDGGGQFLLADTSTTSNLLSDAYLTAGVGTDMNNDPLVMRARFVFDVDIPVDAPVFLFAPDIAASDENATPLDYEVYDRVIVTSPYTVLCANPGGPCDDGDPCTIDDICVGGVCVSGDSIDGAPCDDGDQCTFQDACINGSCTTSPLPECTDGTQLMCAITGAAGSSFTCSLNVANGSALDLPATGLQLDIAYPNSVVLTGFYDGEVCLPACQPWTIPNPFPMLQSGHAVFLSPLDPSMWTTGGEFWLLHFSDPTTPISDAVIDGGGVLQGDPIVVQAFFDIVVDIPSSSPALVTVSDVKPVDQNASLLNFSFQNLLMTTSEP